MKKSELIKLLETIDGNPEIVLWNGYVEDYMNISNKVTKLTLVKETVEFIKENLIAEWCSRHQTWDVPNEVHEHMSEVARRLHKERTWDQPNCFVQDEEFEKWYGKKKLTKYVLSPTLRGKTSFGSDRNSDIKY